MYLLSTTSNEKFAGEVAMHLGERLIQCNVGRFYNGEVRIKNIEISMRNQDVYVIYSAGDDINDEFMEAKLLIRACKQASAKSITLIVPFLPYARQDKKLNAREVISIKLIVDEIEGAGATKILTVDVHNSSIQGMSSCPFDNLTSVPLFAEYIKDNMLLPHMTEHGDDRKNDFVIISPDAGGTERAKNLANLLGLRMATMYKSRSDASVIDSIELLGEVKNKIAIIIDDMADTCGTLKKASEELALHIGPNAIIYAVITHAPFSHNPTHDLPNQQTVQNSALKNVSESKLTRLFVTDSVNLYDKVSQCDKISRISITSLIASAILRYHEERSLSEMLKMTSGEVNKELEKFRMFPKLSNKEQLRELAKMNNMLKAQVAALDAQVSKLTRETDSSGSRSRLSITNSDDDIGTSDSSQSVCGDDKNNDIFGATC